MRSLRELAGAGRQFLRDAVATAELAADAVLETADLLTRIIAASRRLGRAVVTLLEVVLDGARRAGVAFVRMADLLRQLRNLFSPASLRRYRQLYRLEQRLEQMRNRRRAELERDAAEQARRRGDQPQPPPPPPPPLPPAARLPRRRRPRPRARRDPDMDGYASDASVYFSGIEDL